MEEKEWICKLVVILGVCSSVANGEREKVETKQILQDGALE